ncbi:hypothetical protein MXD81_03750 [Microbacteriaceae bacterium K1510]|nr:hypothetical protein [Microbacteriaceae bacterium K1510]
MATPKPPRLPSRPFTLYPRRCFPSLSRRHRAAASDRLLQHVVATLAPPTRPRSQRRRPGASRRRGAKRQRLSLHAAARRWTDLLAIWHHCEQCRDGRRCGGDPFTCLPRHLPHLPSPARLWFACVGIAAERNVSFAEALALTENESEQACTRWHAALGDALRSAGSLRSGARKR